MPATISAVLSSAMPAAAADRPVNALRVEITTGMSAPPIGSTASTPSAPAASRISQNSSCDSAPEAIDDREPDRRSAASAALTARGIAKRPLSVSWSLRNATIEPQNEIEPMIAANRIGISASSSGLPPDSSDSLYSTTEISATAPPPTPLNSATICGIAVMCTLRAAGTPIAVPITSADDDQAPVADPLVDQRRDDGDRHADGGDLVAADRGARPAQHVQARR